MMPIILASIVGIYLLAEGYKKFATTQQKKKWENFVKMHHGEAGTIMVSAGLVTKSPSLIGSGVGLMLHDKNDVNKWFNQKRLR